jgi:alkanesulfonate monooxygenase SsuD/methylene tetrahydromethanopterin reductase-like flavin-dependent oxidoreductase (luciferase family)
MKAGVFMYPQNRGDLERFVARENGEDSTAKYGQDTALWEEDLRFGDLVEPLGFDSIWTVEHHFSPYAMVTSPLQYLAYWAGRTKRIGMGTMVVVLPWHHPMRVAEEMVMLQYMLGDRDLMVGFGRGAARREYGGFNIPQSQSRGRFDEAVQVLRTALTTERFTHKGEFYTIPDISQRPQSPHLSLRPQPRDGKKIVDNFLAAWGSPQSVPVVARLGLRPLIIPQRGFREYVKELDEYYRATVGAGFQPSRPTVAFWTYCGDKKGESRKLVEPYNMGNMALGNVNYEMLDGYHSKIPGYEWYGNMAKAAREAAAAAQADGTPYNDMPQGTPDECIEKINEINDLIHPRQWLFDFKFGGMPYDVAEKSIKLFAKEVLPYVHNLAEPPAPIVERNAAEATA